MRSALLSGPKIRKAYFEASNRKMLLHRPPLKSDFEITFLDLKALRIFSPDKIDGLLITYNPCYSSDPFPLLYTLRN